MKRSDWETSFPFELANPYEAPLSPPSASSKRWSNLVRGVALWMVLAVIALCLVLLIVG